MKARKTLIALAVALVCGLSACQPMEQPLHPPVQAPSLIEEAFFTSDLTALPMTRWLPKGRPSAVLVALHGFNDYHQAFAEPGKYFSAQGIALYAYDQRGFGRTPQRGIWAGQANLVRDASDMVRAVSAQHPGVPIYLLGESMGGAVAIALLAEKPALPLSGAILSAPAVWGGMNWFYQGTLWLGAHTMPGYTLTGSGLKIMASDNIPMLIALGKDPLVIKETRLDAIYGVVNLMDAAQGRISHVQTPLLLLYGANDQVIPRAPVREAFMQVKAPHRVAYYPNGYHMLMRDLQAKLVLRDVISWIRHPTAPLPSGFDAGWRERLDDSTPPAKPSFPTPPTP